MSLPGVLASAAAILVSSFGYIRTKRWKTGVDGQVNVLASTAWQLTAGGLFLLPVCCRVGPRAGAWTTNCSDNGTPYRRP
ncbi:hypothetical protein [Streptomyces sp. NPDC058989]|uniref:hypothetical protein n=1 Tax=Streptomyces sp. NPDC058989 TaxID=3346686 RepID=UPI00367D4FE3